MARRPVVRVLATVVGGLALLGVGFVIGSTKAPDEPAPLAAAPEGLAFVADEGCDDIIAVVAGLSSGATIDETTVEQIGSLRGLVADEMIPSVDRLIAAYEAVAAGDLEHLADDAEVEAIRLAAESLTRHLEERCGIDAAAPGSD